MDSIESLAFLFLALLWMMAAVVPVTGRESIPVMASCVSVSFEEGMAIRTREDQGMMAAVKRF